MNWKHFSLDEFACKHCGENKIDHDFVSDLDALRAVYGRPIRISSGYRCPDHNEAVSSTGRGGPHTTGRAADILVNGQDAYDLLLLIAGMGFTGIGINQKGVWTSRFIHLDTLQRKAVWSY